MLYKLDHELLSKEEELDMIIKSQSGDRKATERLVETNIRSVVQICNKYGLLKTFSEYSDDLIQNGILGLLTAIRKFDTERGLRLSTYAVMWIRQNIFRSIEEGLCTGYISHPSHHSKLCGLLRQIEKAGVILTEENVWQQFQSFVTVADLKYSWGKSQVIESYKFSKMGMISGSNPVGSDDELTEYTVNDVLVSETLSPEEILMQSSRNKTLNEMLESISISQRNKTIVKYRFGLGGCESLTLREVGDLFDMSYENVRLIEISTKRKLKKAFENACIFNLNDIL